MLVPTSEHLLNGWMVNDLCQAWDLRSLLRKFSNQRSSQKQSLRQRLVFKKFTKERCQEVGMREVRNRKGQKANVRMLYGVGHQYG